MTEQEPSAEGIAETDRAIAELKEELARIGVNMEAVAAALGARYQDVFRQAMQEGGMAFGIDAPSALAAARTLESGAGTSAFLTALGLPNAPSTELE
jgi:hypothetical protein